MSNNLELKTYNDILPLLKELEVNDGRLKRISRIQILCASLTSIVFLLGISYWSISTGHDPFKLFVNAKPLLALSGCTLFEAFLGVYKIVLKTKNQTTYYLLLTAIKLSDHKLFTNSIQIEDEFLKNLVSQLILTKSDD